MNSHGIAIINQNLNKEILPILYKNVKNGFN